MEWLLGWPEGSRAERCPGSGPLPAGRVSATHPNPAWHPKPSSLWLPLPPILHPTLPRAVPEPPRPRSTLDTSSLSLKFLPSMGMRRGFGLTRMTGALVFEARGLMPPPISRMTNVPPRTIAFLLRGIFPSVAGFAAIFVGLWKGLDVGLIYHGGGMIPSLAAGGRLVDLRPGAGGGFCLALARDPSPLE